MKQPTTTGARHAQLFWCLTLQGEPCFTSCHSEGPQTLTYVGKLALCAQGHGERRRGRQLCLVVGFWKSADGVGVPPLLALLLGLKLVPEEVAEGLTQSELLQSDSRGLAVWGCLS